jgi:hypothetical protein
LAPTCGGSEGWFCARKPRYTCGLELPDKILNIPETIITSCFQNGLTLLRHEHVLDDIDIASAVDHKFAAWIASLEIRENVV